MLKEAVLGLTLLGGGWAGYEYVDVTYVKVSQFVALESRMTENQIRGQIAWLRREIRQMEREGCPPCRNRDARETYNRTKAELRDAEARLRALWRN